MIRKTRESIFMSLATSKRMPFDIDMDNSVLHYSADSLSFVKRVGKFHSKLILKVIFKVPGKYAYFRRDCRLEPLDTIVSKGGSEYEKLIELLLFHFNKGYEENKKQATKLIKSLLNGETLTLSFDLEFETE